MQAKQLFQKAAGMTCNGKKNISGLLALADMTFQEGEYRSALSMYATHLSLSMQHALGSCMSADQMLYSIQSQAVGHRASKDILTALHVIM